MTTLLEEIAEFFDDRMRRFGATPAAVDVRSEESQRTRFEQLSKMIADPAGSVLDFGCGYGATLDYLREHGFVGAYYGIDLAPEMIESAIKNHAHDPLAHFQVGSIPGVTADYVIASGIFNLRQTRGKAEWQGFVEATVAMMNGAAAKGFAFNCLTSYSDLERMRDDLYYGDPCYYFDLCKRQYSRQVALLHDYGLWEFTIIVRKT